MGFVIGPEKLMRHVMAAHLVLAYSSSTPAQEACALGLREAERSDWWRTNANDVAERVGKVGAILSEVGLTVSRCSSLPHIGQLIVFFLCSTSLRPAPTSSLSTSKRSSFPRTTLSLRLLLPMAPRTGRRATFWFRNLGCLLSLAHVGSS